MEKLLYTIKSMADAELYLGRWLKQPEIMRGGLKKEDFVKHAYGDFEFPEGAFIELRQRSLASMEEAKDDNEKLSPFFIDQYYDGSGSFARPIHVYLITKDQE